MTALTLQCKACTRIWEPTAADIKKREIIFALWHVDLPYGCPDCLSQDITQAQHALDDIDKKLAERERKEAEA